ncbi:putative transcription factor interactor and regulator LIM family [Helianthus annuus]|nr:putative transcription factor interactor and regulator LIM family [Helianthus annuus]
MGWLSKFFKGSNHEVSEGDYNWRYEDNTAPYGNYPSTSWDPRSEIDDIDRAIAISLAEEDGRGKHVISDDYQLKEDEQLARALQESLKVESPPRHRYGNRNGNGNGNMYQPIPFPYSTGFRVCAGCNYEIGHGRFLSCMGAVWHPECFRCHACNQQIADYEFSVSGNYPYHKACYKEHYHPKCDVCKHFVSIVYHKNTPFCSSICNSTLFIYLQIPTNSAGLIEYRAHPFWAQKYCPSHEHDGTPRCCSCERMEPRETSYAALNDGRKLCLECLDSSVMDTSECQPLYYDIQAFYESLNMRVEQKIPLLLVERQALNEAMDGERNGHYHMPETRGLCLSEEQTISTVLRRPRIGMGNRVPDMRTEPYKLTRRCEVTAILVLYGLPRLLTGSILAHEMMHAWLRLQGYRTLSQDVEEGICQVLAHMWLKSQIAFISSSNTSSATSSRQGKRSPFDKKLAEFFKHQIESDMSPVYGNGFRAGNQAVLKYGLPSTLEHIRLTGSFPF